jgi:DNA primase
MRPAAIEAARQAHLLADVAERTGIDLPRRSGSVNVHCPFPDHGHYDRRPSLHLSLDKGLFHCFGCNLSGDVVEWVRRSEGVTWPEAVAVLDSGRPLTNAWTSRHESGAGSGRSRDAGRSGARRADQRGHTLPDLDRTPVERVVATLEAAWAHLTSPRLHDRGATYLAGRGIDIAAVEHHTSRSEVGHTPDGATGLVTVLLRDGFTPDELVDGGLARRTGAGLLTDFFRYRVLIPIRTEDGRICGFGGRNVGDDRWPKYLNSPRTVAYDKSVELYQPLPAPTHPEGRVVVVEGTLDALAVAALAIRGGHANRLCPVSPLGKELSAGQLYRLLDLAPNPLVVAFDGDPAGRKATERLVQRISDRALPADVIDLPDGHDPASWLTANARWGFEYSISSGPPPPAGRHDHRTEPTPSMPAGPALEQ